MVFSWLTLDGWDASGIGRHVDHVPLEELAGIGAEAVFPGLVDWMLLEYFGDVGGACRVGRIVFLYSVVDAGADGQLCSVVVSHRYPP
ncbi:hypothetical protein B5P44_00555 [Mycobacterium sp. CBMA 213]|uniref:Uncharacterized protein n=1 Tax=Mycolicibacterium sp. CBMA 213 TaxID=1968788 RepID=A0A343VR94_9MYCO|nr:hypothetical protein [Mycolicibacterium sp. CBMA 335]AVN58418.1 hypothetical protein B5P44_p00123 [Mycolicibacterium sp. CBMA 213]MUL61076.1 hypothetical protein [Mycolicibacterium sp. CBMA 335]MUM03314.1 hypothetical protein [Mycolicibacterium sp. CBMA 213]